MQTTHYKRTGAAKLLKQLAHARFGSAGDLLRSDQGSALVEFALFTPVLVFTFVAMVDYAIMTQQAMQVQDAATSGAEYGIIPGNQTDTSGMQTAATKAAAGLSGFSAVATNIFTCSPGGATVASSTSCSSYGTPIEYVQVQTTATASPLLAYTGITSLTLKGYAAIRVPWTP
jgi:Flp pilus assembly protein TadG